MAVGNPAGSRDRDAVAVPTPLVDAVVIVGFGRAGSGLHLAAVRELYANRPDGVPPVLAVDPKRAGRHGAVQVFDGLDDAVARLPAPDRAVFHVAVGPQLHAPVTRRLLGLGARRLIVEKPLAATPQLAARMVATVREHGARLAPVSVWPHSSATEAVLERIAAAGPAPLRIHFAQHKPRLDRTMADARHRSVFEVELPHQVLLAVVLGGPVAAIQEASVWPARRRGRTVPAMGGARLVLRHRTGSVSELVSDLTAATRSRRLLVAGPGLRLAVDYPASAASATSRMVDLTVGRTWTLPDRPLTRFLGEAYAWLGDASPSPPRVPLAVQLHALGVLHAAAQHAVVSPQEVPPQ